MRSLAGLIAEMSVTAAEILVTWMPTISFPEPRSLWPAVRKRELWDHFRHAP